MNGKYLLILVLTAAIAGMSTDYWIQGLVNMNKIDYWSIKYDELTFVASAVTSGLAIGAIVLMKIGNNNNLPLFLTMITLILWVICLLIAVLNEKGKRQTMRGIIYVTMCSGCIITHFIAGSFNT